MTVNCKYTAKAVCGVVLTVHDFFFPAVGLKLSSLIANASGYKKSTKKRKSSLDVAHLHVITLVDVNRLPWQPSCIFNMV